MEIKDVISVIEKFAPIELAEDWDKIGLMCGSIERECKKVAVCLDLTLDVADAAIENGCNLILTHHPFIFYAINIINTDGTYGKIIEKLIKNEITVYSAHTNLDKTVGGINTCLAGKLGAVKIENNGIGALFEIEPTTLGGFAKLVSERLGDNSVKYTGNSDCAIQRVYAVCGSGFDDKQYNYARTRADVFLTGDIKHFAFLNAAGDGFPLVEFSHYASECFVNDIFEMALKKELPNLDVFKPKQSHPFKMFYEQ